MNKLIKFEDSKKNNSLNQKELENDHTNKFQLNLQKLKNNFSHDIIKDKLEKLKTNNIYITSRVSSPDEEEKNIYSRRMQLNNLKNQIIDSKSKNPEYDLDNHSHNRHFRKKEERVEVKVNSAKTWMFQLVIILFAFFIICIIALQALQHWHIVENNKIKIVVFDDD